MRPTRSSMAASSSSSAYLVLGRRVQDRAGKGSMGTPLYACVIASLARLTDTCTVFLRDSCAPFPHRSSIAAALRQLRSIDGPLKPILRNTTHEIDYFIYLLPFFGSAVVDCLFVV
ncbi:hypothetical protein PENSPDRAFT_432514 [Peniophora sp. CONT]|nr:hypothetical protein PENSPDRAFT_432514 [Peniophora sp. CONT]